MKKLRYRLIFDPPEGWKYGFPKAVLEFKGDKSIGELIKEISIPDILKEASYPENLIPLALQYSRFWIEEVKK